MKINEEKKKVDAKGEYIVIHKETFVNYFFVSVLVIALGLFIALLVSGVIKTIAQNSKVIDTNLIQYYEDELLNIHYPVPGGSWSFVEFDKSEIEDTIKESMGEDEYFSIDDDVLTKEVISMLGVNETLSDSAESSDNVGGIREFMSFTFMPDMGYTGDEFIEYSKALFEKSIEESGNIDNYDLYFTEKDEYQGVLMKMLVMQVTDSGSLEETYYTQYIKKIGKNIGVITYGSLINDETVDPYLQFFLNNVLTEKSLMG